MPAVAVVGGIAAASAGVAAMTTALAAASVSALAVISAGLTIVSGVATALGAITGSKTLQKIGAAAGLGSMAVGGLSSLSNATGTASTATKVGDVAKSASNISMKPLADVSGAASSSIADVAPVVGSAGQGVVPQASTSLQQRANVQRAPSAVGPAGSEMADAASGLRIPDLSSQAPSLTEGGFDGIFGGIGSKLKDLISTPEGRKMAFGLLGGATDAYAADRERKAILKREDELIDRYNNSILGQRARY